MEENINTIISFEEFKLIFQENYSVNELEFIKKTCLKLGFKNFQEYQGVLYDYVENGYNVYLIANEIINVVKSDKYTSCNLNNLFKKHINNDCFNKYDHIYTKSKKLSKTTISKVSKFEQKLYKLLFTKLIEYLEKDEAIMNIVYGLLKDFDIQTSFIESNNSISTLNYIESLKLANTKFAVNKINEPNFYFPNKALFLNSIYKMLIELKYIEPNDDFVKTFKNMNFSNKITYTLWIVDFPKLLYLLYRLNDNQESFKGIRLEKIANTLFKFKTQKTLDNIRMSFSKTIKNFSEINYIEKKLKILNKHLDEILK